MFLWPTLSELFAETFHARLKSFVCMGRHIGVPFWCTNMAVGNQQNHLDFTFSTNLKLFLFTRELAYVRINISSNI